MNKQIVCVCVCTRVNASTWVFVASYPVEVSVDTVVEDLGGQLGVSELWPEERRLDNHTVRLPLPPQVPDEDQIKSCYLKAQGGRGEEGS